MTPFDKADLVLKNGRIVTLNPKDEIVEAVAVKDGSIVCTGSTKEIEASVDNNSSVIDLKGKTVTPGFVESHCHPSMAVLDRDILSIPAEEIKDMQVEMTIVGGELVYQNDG